MGFYRQKNVEPLEVYVDEGLETRPQKKARTTTHEHKGLTIRQTLEKGATEEELLYKKPMKNFLEIQNEQGEEKAAPPKLESEKISLNDNSSKTKERVVYNKEILEAESGESLSFEEIRAKAYAIKYRHLEQVPQSEPVQMHPVNENSFLLDPSTGQDNDGNNFLNNTSICMDNVARRLSFATSVKKPSPRAQHTAHLFQGINKLNQAAQEDMTINTRVAMEDVNDMFCSPKSEKPEAIMDVKPNYEEQQVERKLHFSIYDDSVECIAPSLLTEKPQPTDNTFKCAKEPFEIFSDECGANSAQNLVKKHPNKVEKNLLSSMSIMKKNRRPLGERNDLVKNTRMTNRDAILKICETEGPMEVDQVPINPR
jgi:hypothetical protein